MTSVKSREYLVYKEFSERIPLMSEGLFCKELVLRGEMRWVMRWLEWLEKWGFRKGGGRTDQRTL